MIKNTQEMKNENEKIIVNAVKEILYKGLRVKEKSLGSLEDDVGLMMRALQIKNKIYDYAVFTTHNSLLNRFEMKLAYSLINVEDMTEEEAEPYEAVLEFNF